MNINTHTGGNCTSDLMLNVSVNTYDDVGTLSPFLWDFYPTLGCHDIQSVLENNYNF